MPDAMIADFAPPVPPMLEEDNYHLCYEAEQIVKGKSRTMATTAHLKAVLALCESFLGALNDRDVLIAELIKRRPS